MKLYKPGGQLICLNCTRFADVSVQ